MAAAKLAATVDIEKIFVIMQGILNALSRRNATNTLKELKRGAGSRSERLCLLLQTILPVICRECSADWGKFAKVGTVVTAGW